MKVAFLTEMGFSGKISADHPNMRTEFAWMHALNADHYNIYSCLTNEEVSNYDHVFVIFPKGVTFLNCIGSPIVQNAINPVSQILASDLVDKLRQKGNIKIHYVQEGPHWLWNDYEIPDQINFYNMLAQCDSIFAHNEYDVKYYKGLFRSKPVEVIHALMIEHFVSSLASEKQDKVIIGGNFARWYGGFESYIVASVFEMPIYAQSSHVKRQSEEYVDNLTHLPRLYWNDWMNSLKDFKYAVHLMPTVAAGTFSLNCAYFGIPCIGNKNVDTQRLCHPELSVDVADVESAVQLANRLKDDKDFYNLCSSYAKENYVNHYSEKVWKTKMNKILCQ
jgi:hypothetical protein